MKALVCAIALLCCMSSSFAVIDEAKGNQLFEKVKASTLVTNNAELVEKVRRRVYHKGCDINVCFALDGSKSVGDNFAIEKEFVNLIAAIVGADEGELAGTIFGFVNVDISKLTTEAANFILDVNAATFPDAPVTFLSAGLGFCFRELDSPHIATDVNRIVMLSDGFSNFGDLVGLLNPNAIAEQWRARNPGNNQFCAVGVGFPNIDGLSGITGDMERIFEVDKWPQVIDILDPLFSCLCPNYGRPLSVRFTPGPVV